MTTTWECDTLVYVKQILSKYESRNPVTVLDMEIDRDVEGNVLALHYGKVSGKSGDPFQLDGFDRQKDGLWSSRVAAGEAGKSLRCLKKAEKAAVADYLEQESATAARGEETVATMAGRQAHKESADKVKQKPGWRSKPQDQIDPATGRKVIPDALTSSGRPVELKPNTPSGRRAEANQLEKYERATVKKGRVVYYGPKR